jgi:hypothetical protein
MAHDGTTRLEDHRNVGATQLRQDGRRVLGRGDHRPPLVSDPKSAPEIDVFQRNAIVSQFECERCQRGRGPPQRFGRGDLRPDVNVHADELEVLDVTPLTIDRARILQRDPELVAAQSRGDVRMALGVDVRIHAQRHTNDPAGGPGTVGDPIELPGDSALIACTSRKMA